MDELKAEGVEANFVAIRLPYAVQHDEDDAQAAMDFIRAETEWTFNISAAVDGSRTRHRCSRPAKRTRANGSSSAPTHDGSGAQPGAVTGSVPPAHTHANARCRAHELRRLKSPVRPPSRPWGRG